MQLCEPFISQEQPQEKPAAVLRFSESIPFLLQEEVPDIAVFDSVAAHLIMTISLPSGTIAIISRVYWNFNENRYFLAVITDKVYLRKENK